MVRVENQLELAYVSQKNISLHCTSESFPPAIHYWKHSNGSAISGGNRAFATKHTIINTIESIISTLAGLCAYFLRAVALNPKIGILAQNRPGLV